MTETDRCVALVLASIEGRITAAQAVDAIMSPSRSQLEIVIADAAMDATVPFPRALRRASARARRSL